ncbi:hypothetical protein DPEC_G00266890 [Dallia pectoralis]|uniref:Uncharacterized protein n=1 Tax=Dallia pectoralis TaxID=75939 RepID=A0ACC2FNG1_DALPE|nr:hypothetical protein DPEC_G00266890 [Dallia pectoralis]
MKTRENFPSVSSCYSKLLPEFLLGTFISNLSPRSVKSCEGGGFRERGGGIGILMCGPVQCDSLLPSQLLCRESTPLHASLALPRVPLGDCRSPSTGSVSLPDDISSIALYLARLACCHIVITLGTLMSTRAALSLCLTSLSGSVCVLVFI